MSKKVKIFALVVVVIAIIILATSILGGKKTPYPSNPTKSPLSSATGVIPLPGATANTTNNDEFSSLLSNINRITIDTSLFDNSAYKLLRDFPVSLGSDVVGRSNPFAPIGSDNESSSQTVLVQTIQPGKITSNSAELGAQVTLPDTVPTNIVFEYGTTDTFGSASAPVVVSKSTTTLITINKLNPETTYYVRAVANRGGSTILGNTTSFTTLKK